MSKSRERSGASYSTSRAEQMAIEWLKTEYQAQDVHEDYLDERQGDEAFAFLAGMKAMLVEVEQLAEQEAISGVAINKDRFLMKLKKLMEQDG